MSFVAPSNVNGTCEDNIMRGKPGGCEVLVGGREVGGCRNIPPRPPMTLPTHMCYCKPGYQINPYNRQQCV